MSIKGGISGSMLNDDVIAVSVRIIAGGLDPAGIRCPDRCAFRSCQIYASMKVQNILAIVVLDIPAAIIRGNIDWRHRVKKRATSLEECLIVEYGIMSIIPVPPDRVFPVLFFVPVIGYHVIVHPFRGISAMIVGIAYISCFKMPAAFIFVFQAVYLKNNSQTFRIIRGGYASGIH